MKPAALFLIGFLAVAALIMSMINKKNSDDNDSNIEQLQSNENGKEIDTESDNEKPN